MLPIFRFRGWKSERINVFRGNELRVAVVLDAPNFARPKMGYGKIDAALQLAIRGGPQLSTNAD
jgi:hypothetical protein